MQSPLARASFEGRLRCSFIPDPWPLSSRVSPSRARQVVISALLLRSYPPFADNRSACGYCTREAIRPSFACVIMTSPPSPNSTLHPSVQTRNAHRCAYSALGSPPRAPRSSSPLICDILPLHPRKPPSSVQTSSRKPYRPRAPLRYSLNSDSFPSDDFPIHLCGGQSSLSIATVLPGTRVEIRTPLDFFLLRELSFSPTPSFGVSHLLAYPGLPGSFTSAYAS